MKSIRIFRHIDCEGPAHLQTLLEQQGWQPAAVRGPLSAMNWLAPEPDIGKLPILPHVHDGEHQSLLLIGPIEPAREQLVVIRLWPANTWSPCWAIFCGGSIS